MAKKQNISNIAEKNDTEFIIMRKKTFIKDTDKEKDKLFISNSFLN